MSRTILLAVVVLLCAASRGADAGRNNNGALIVHTNDAAVYSADDDYCGTVFDEHAPADCAAAITRTDKGEEEIAVIWFLAAFTEHHHPQINAIQFGVDHNLPADAGQVSAWGACGPTPQEIPEEGWPAVPSGNIVGFGEPITDRLFPFYWFAVRGAGAGSHFGTGADPVRGKAVFADDSRPPVEDDVTRFGRVDWFGPGSNACPEPPLLGGCCFQSDARCEIVDYSFCADSAGVYLGDGSGCDQCSRCCYAEGEFLHRCILTTETECFSRSQDGYTAVWREDCQICDSWPCEAFYDCAVPARSRTWGEVKALFR